MSDLKLICAYCAQEFATGSTHACLAMSGAPVTLEYISGSPPKAAPIVTDAMIEAGLEACAQYTRSLGSDPESFKGGRYLAAIFLAMHAAMVNPPPQTADGSDAAPT